MLALFAIAFDRVVSFKRDTNTVLHTQLIQVFDYPLAE